MTRYLMLALILTATGLTPVHANQPEEMSLISGGTFEMGVKMVRSTPCTLSRSVRS